MPTKLELEDKLMRAHEAGDSQSAQVLAHLIRSGEYSGETSKLESLGRGALQGATLGFSDEASAALRAGLDKATQGGDFSELYQMYRGDERGKIDTARSDNPNTFLAGEIGSGLLYGAGGAARATAASTGRQALARGVGTGAAFGAGAGAGYSEADDAGGLMEDTLQGGALGGAFGAAAPVVGAGLRKAGGAISKVFGPNAAHNRAVADIHKAVTKDLQSYEAGGRIQSIGIDDFQKILDDNPNMLIADVGPHTQTIMKELVAHGGEHGNAINEFLTLTRAGGAQTRILQDISEGLGVKGRDYLKSVQTATQGMRDRANAGYEAIHAQQVRVTPKMRKLLTETKLGEKVQRRVNSLSAGEYDMPMIDEGVQSVSGRQMDYLMRAMDSEVNKAWRKKGDQFAGEQFGKVRDHFRSSIEKGMKGYRAVRNQYRGDKDDMDAFELGRKLLKEDLEITSAEMRDLSKTGKEYFRIGVAKGVRDAVKSGQSTGDVADKFLARPQLKEALRVAFGNGRKFKQFVKKLEVESRQADSAKIARSANPMDAPQTPNELVGALGVFGGAQAAKVAGSNPLLMAGAGRRIAQRMAPESSALRHTYQEMSPLLLSRSVDDLMPRGGLLSPAYNGSGYGLAPAAGILGGSE